MKCVAVGSWPGLKALGTCLELIKGGLVSETKVDYHHQKKNFTYFHYFITLSPPFDHYRDNKAGPGGGVTPIYGLYRYVPRNRVWFLRFLVLK